MLKSCLAVAPLAALLIAVPAAAQVYTSSQFAAPYVQVSNGTAIAFDSDDDAVTVIQIGFPFTYYGTTYSAISVGTNGFAVLAASCTGSGLNCQDSAFCDAGFCTDFGSTVAPGTFPNIDEPNLAFAPFWDDLVIRSGGQVLTAVEGAAPNRTRVIEWRNVLHYGFPSPPGVANFQIRLSESGTVRLAWGAFTGSPAMGDWTGDIGVENDDGTVGFVPNRPCTAVAASCSHPDLQALNGQVLEVGLVNGPELIGLVNPPPGADPGQQLAIGVSARNVGTQTTTAAIVARVYLSTDAAIVAGVDTFLGQVNLPVIPAGQVRTATLTATMPAMLMPGRYRIGAIVDATNVIRESSESNNTAVSGEFLVGPNVFATIGAPESTGPSEPIAFPVTITSNGSPVQGVFYRLYLSTDGTLDPAVDTLVGTGTAAVAGRPSLTFDAMGEVPANIIPASYFAIIRLDPLNRIIELDEMDNVAASAEAVDVVGPDVAVTEIDGAATAFRGETYRIHAVLRNLGGTTAREFFYTFYLSDNQLVTATDPAICEFGPFDLAPGAVMTVDHDCIVPRTLDAGAYYLGAIADSTTVVLEGDERNNIRFRRPAIEVRDTAPDLAVYELFVPNLAAVGEAFTIGRAFDNIGNAPGTAAYAAYLSTDRTFDAATDVEVARGMVTMAPGARESGVDQGRVPQQVAAGVYYVIYRLDPEATLEELSETNNVAVSPTTVRVDAAQLQVLSRILPQATVGLPYQFDLGASGGSGAYTWTIDQGTLPAGLSLDAQSGRISGTPEAPAQVTLGVRVADAESFAQVSLTLLVAESTIDLEIISRAIPPSFVGRPYEIPLTAIGGIPPYVWTVDGALPPGFTLSQEGVLSGTPTTVGASAVNFRVNDVSGTRAERPITVRVIASEDALRFTTDILQDGERARRYDDRFRATNGQPPYVFELIDGELPGGLDIVDDTLVGTPTVTGTFVFAVRVTDERADFDTNRFVVRITGDGDGVRFVSNALPDGEKGAAYVEEGGSTVRLKAVAQAGVEGELTYSLIAGDLPAGLTLAADGAISGTPTTSGLFTFTAQVQDSARLTDHRAFAIVVTDPPVDPEVVIPPDGCGCATAQPTSMVGLGLLGLVMFGLRRRSPRRRWLGGALVAGLTVGTLAAAPRAALAQGAPYILQEETATYVERRGGTPVVFGSTDDDEVVVPLPFPFRFFATDYSEVHVGTNGLVTFGESADSLGNANFGSSTTPNNVIALYWDDLLANAVQYFTDGAAPSRIFVIQWNAPHLSGGGSLLAQLWLYEGSAGRFEIHYGAGGGGNNFTASMGFENAAGTTTHSWRTCSPSCSGADLAALANVVLRATQDGGPDVVAQSVTAPARVYAGVAFPVTARFASVHQNPVGPFRYGYQLIPASGPAVELESFGPVTLTPYQTLTVNDEITIPVLSPPGSYRIALVIDPAQSFAEPDENNNRVVSASAVEVGERRPDFTAARVTARSAQASPGDTVDVVVQLRNAGNLPGGFEWDLVLSGNRVISVDDLVVHTASVTLPVLGTFTTTIAVTLPVSLEAGRYWFGVVADPDDAVLELSEVNNAVATADPVQVGVDFLEVATEGLPGGYVGIDYSTFLRGAGGDGTYTWAISGGTLPAGLTLLPMSGELRGKPSAAGMATVTVQVTSAGRTAERSLTLVIGERTGPLTIVTRALVPGVVGLPYPPGDQAQRVQVVNGSGDVSFRLTGVAPAGLELSSDGVLSGTPRQRGVYEVAIEATDSVATATRTIPLTVVEPGRLALIAADLPQGALDDDYRVQLQAVGATSTVTFTMGVDSLLPDGLALTSAGLIIGVPQRVGTWRFSVVATDGSSGDEANFTIQVVTSAGFSVTPSSLPVAVVGTAYDAVLEARGGTPMFTWRVVFASTNGTLPRGLRFQVETIDGREKLRFLGTPEEVPAGGVVTFLVAVEDTAGRLVEVPLAIRVTTPPPAPPKVVEPDGCSTVGGAGDAGLLLVAVGMMLIARRRRVSRAGRSSERTV